MALGGMKLHRHDFYGAVVDCMLPGVQVTTELGFLPHSSHLCDNEDCDSLL